MSMYDLRPCPFCGGQADKHIDDYGEGKFYVTVCCHKCGAKVSNKGAIETATEQAVDAWNRRADNGKDSEIAPDDLKRLLSLLFMPFASDPHSRKISINAQINGKSVNITYDPHDPEAVKAADMWRKALFAEPSESAPKNGNCLYISDKVRYALDAIAYLSGNVKGRYTYIPLTVKQRRAIDELYEDLHSREPLDAANLFKPGSYEPKDLPPTEPDRMTELEKASEPLREYMKAHGDPHTSVIVTQYGATEAQDERRVTFDGEKPTDTVKSNEPAAHEPDKLDYDPLCNTLIDPLPFEYLCYWQKIAEEYAKVREAWDNGKRARIPRHIIDSLSVLSKRLSKDYKEAVETRWPKPAATDEGGTT